MSSRNALPSKVGWGRHPKHLRLRQLSRHQGGIGKNAQAESCTNIFRDWCANPQPPPRRSNICVSWTDARDLWHARTYANFYPAHIKRVIRLAVFNH